MWFDNLGVVLIDDVPLVDYHQDLIAINILTKEVITFYNTFETSKYTGVNNVSVIDACNTRKVWPTNNWCFRWLDDIEQYPFRKFSDEEVECFKGKSSIMKPICLIDELGNKTIFSEFKSLSKICNFDRANLHKAITSGKLYKGKYRIIYL